MALATLAPETTAVSDPVSAETAAPAAADRADDLCANCATTPCVFCRANELLIGYGITDYSITRSL